MILYDGKTGERLSELGAPAAHTGSIYGLCWDSTSRFILTASGDKTAKIWDVTTGSAVQLVENFNHIFLLKFVFFLFILEHIHLVQI